MRFSPWQLALCVFDAAITAAAAFIGVTLYFNGGIPAVIWDALQVTLPITMAVVIICNILFGLYNRVWKYAGAETAVAIGLSTTTALLLAAFVGKWVATPLPIVVWYTTWLFCLFAMSGSRFFWRVVRPTLEAVTSGQSRNGNEGGVKRVLVYGAGERGSSLIHIVGDQTNPDLCIVGFVDDNPRKQGAYLGGYRVLGTGDQLPTLVKQHQVDEVVITISDISKSRLQEILQLCRLAKVKPTVVPSLFELMDGQRARPREVNVEDLLGREGALTHVALHHNYLEGKTVLVTGAGGSIGSELSRQICRHKPKHVILLGRGENRIHWIYLQLQERHPDLQITPIIHNITVTAAMDKVFDRYRPDIVFHAAAHKHVYLMEPVPAEAVRNNVLGTRDLAQLASKYGVEKFIFISTDKAVTPTSVMGATKRACELLLVSRPCSKTKYICVRFGNVLGSEGSVLEIFKRQWKNGEPLTVTHEDASRYFMSIPEASFLVMQAGALGTHGEVFLLDMGEPVRIKKLAEEFISLHGGNPYDPHAIKLIGLQEGEKLHEALAYDSESLVATSNPHVIKICDPSSGLSYEAIEEYLRLLTLAVQANDDETALRVLAELTGGNLRSRRQVVLSKVI
jgi:FlaA1/EpsC-like NDP-sugar epimerase